MSRVTYVYGLAEGQEPVDLSSVPSLPGAGAPRWLPLEPPRKGDGSAALALVVADASEKTFGEEVLQERMKDFDWVSACAVAHDAAVEAVARSATVVPLRMFTLFHDEARARSAMQGRSSALLPVLGRLRGRDEWVVRIVALKAPEPVSTPAASGTAFLTGKIQRKQDQQERVQAAAARAQEIKERLSALADEVVVHPPPREGVAALVDAAFLVPRAQLPRFQKEVASLARQAEKQHLRVTLTGPWPAYSFTGAR